MDVACEGQTAIMSRPLRARMTIYPRVVKAVPVEFDWEPFSSVTLFSTQDSYAEVLDWYLREFPDADHRPQSDGHSESYLPDRTQPESSILLADLDVPEAVANLDAYIGSTRLMPLASDRSAHVLGALFIHRR
jgi:hypothetical protein